MNLSMNQSLVSFLSDRTNSSPNRRMFSSYVSHPTTWNWKPKPSFSSPLQTLVLCCQTLASIAQPKTPFQKHMCEGLFSAHYMFDQLLESKNYLVSSRLPLSPRLFPLKHNIKTCIKLQFHTSCIEKILCSTTNPGRRLIVTPG